MKTKLFLTLCAAVFLLSCRKENFLQNYKEAEREAANAKTFDQLNTYRIAALRDAGGTGNGEITSIPYGLLGLNNGTFSINSANNLIADIGYGMGVTSTTNQKVNNFSGTATVHSGISTFKYATSSFQPSNGIIRNNAEAAMMPMKEIV